MRLLVAEGDPALGRFLSTGLRADGHEVEWAADGDVALERFAEDTPNLVIMDLSLPRRDGVEVLRSLRAADENVPVLVLTAQHEVAVRVRCLDLGADDCMLKPFSLNELRARCRALLRRRKETGAVLHHADVELDRMTRCVRRDGQTIALTNKECALLEHLMVHRGRCVSREALLEQVWKMSPASNTNVVDVYINYLRRKLDGDGSAPLIWTVRGKGYCFGGRPSPVSV